MFLDVAGKVLPAPTSFTFGVGDWIALGVTLALFVVAFVVPNIVANRASGRKAARSAETLTNRRVGTPA
jgi:hypothetical protein